MSRPARCPPAAALVVACLTLTGCGGGSDPSAADSSAASASTSVPASGDPTGNSGAATGAESDSSGALVPACRRMVLDLAAIRRVLNPRSTITAAAATATRKLAAKVKVDAVGGPAQIVGGATGFADSVTDTLDAGSSAAAANLIVLSAGQLIDLCHATR